MINYALGGASAYAPKNTLSAFYTALIMGADGIKTEIRLSKDKTAVLFSDDNLENLTDADGIIENYTVSQLKYLKVKGRNGFFDRIVTLEEFLSVFSAYNVNFLLELKVPDADEQVLSLINKYRVVKNIVIASSEPDYIKTVRQKCDYVKLCLITDTDGISEIQALKEIDGYMICIDAKVLTKKSLETLTECGFEVCAHNITDKRLAKKMQSIGVDAIITDFPDKLT